MDLGKSFSQSWPINFGSIGSVFGDREGCQSYRPAIMDIPLALSRRDRVAEENRDCLRRSKEDARSESTRNAADPRVGRMSELFGCVFRSVLASSTGRVLQVSPTYTRTGERFAVLPFLNVTKGYVWVPVTRCGTLVEYLSLDLG